MSFRSLVSLPRDQLRIFEVERRTLFVPLVGFNAVYRWSGGKGRRLPASWSDAIRTARRWRRSASTKGAKTFRGLARAEHTLRVRH